MRVPKHREPTHAGEVFRCTVLEPLGLSVTEAARKLKVSRKALSSVLNGGELSLTMAKKWAIATDTSVEFWYNLQVIRNLWSIENETIEADSLLQTA